MTAQGHNAGLCRGSGEPRRGAMWDCARVQCGAAQGCDVGPHRVQCKAALGDSMGLCKGATRDCVGVLCRAAHEHSVGLR